MKIYRVFASQTVYYVKTIEADSPEQAEELAWEQDNGLGWDDFDYGEWQLEEVREIKGRLE